MSWAPRKGAVHSREAVMEVWRQHGLAWRCDAASAGSSRSAGWQVVEQKDVPRADWGRNLAQGVGFLFNHEPLEVPRPSSLMERVKLFEKSQAFPESRRSTPHPMAKLPSQLFQEPRDAPVGAALAMR